MPPDHPSPKVILIGDHMTHASSESIARRLMAHSCFAGVIAMPFQVESLTEATERLKATSKSLDHLRNATAGTTTSMAELIAELRGTAATAGPYPTANTVQRKSPVATQKRLPNQPFYRGLGRWRKR